METGISSKVEATFKAPASRVWKALTDPVEVKQYLFGTDMSVSEWKVGGSISYKGIWQDKEYEDKGKILKYIPEKLLVTSYWSAFSGKPDLPENYQIVSYQLTPEDGGTKLIITQDNVASEEGKKHSEGNWKMVLDAMKKVVEGVIPGITPPKGGE
jgi:uncharacterized protein YndB with AHSA1/START domain